jgi:hypothetical protein
MTSSLNQLSYVAGDPVRLPAMLSSLVHPVPDEDNDHPTNEHLQRTNTTSPFTHTVHNPVTPFTATSHPSTNHSNIPNCSSDKDMRSHPSPDRLYDAFWDDDWVHLTQVPMYKRYVFRWIFTYSPGYFTCLTSPAF